MKTKCKTSKCDAACCYNVPLKNNELERFADKIVNKVIGVTRLFGASVPVTDQNILKNKCPFLRSDFKCNIYENRPDVCRKFGTIPELPCKFIKTK